MLQSAAIAIIFIAPPPGDESLLAEQIGIL
jgi:hypothetical protein